MGIEVLRKELEKSIKCNGINHSRTTELRESLEEEINKKQRVIYEEYKEKNCL